MGVQTAEVLRRAIEAGEFDDVLPPERRLSEDLGVSRPILRDALTRLEREGRIERKGRRRFVAGQGSPKTRGRDIRCVRLLISDARSVLDNEAVALQEFLAERLHEMGVGFRVEPAPACFRSDPARHLTALTKSMPSTLWILLRSTAAMQHWFQSVGPAAVVCGSCHPGVNLPSVDADYAAICRHAAGLLLRRGHRCVAVLAPRVKLPGDAEGLRGFREGIHRASPPGVRLECLTHSGDRTTIGVVLNRAMVHSERPTALLVFGSLSYLSAASHLARRGLGIGSDVSLICRDYDPFLDEMLPSVAHYRRDTPRFRKQILAAIRNALEGAPGPRGARRVMAEFHPGESLGARP